MMVLVSYDVATTTTAGRRRLRRVAKTCLDFGQRVQLSVFECPVEPAQWAALKNRLLKEIDPATDSLRFYYLGANWRRRVEHVAPSPRSTWRGRSWSDGVRTPSGLAAPGRFAIRLFAAAATGYA